METALILLSVQGLVGAFDNLWHHQITQKLHLRPEARGELALHTVREFLYAAIFVTIAWTSWDGLLAYALAGIMAVEIVVTLWDFVVEDRTRRLPRAERIVHTLLAINFGVFLAVFAPVLAEWARRDTGFGAADYGVLSWIMTAYGIGVFFWALYDTAVVIRLSVPEWQRRPFRAGKSDAPKSVLVTGATGFIGRDLIRALVRRGDRPIVLARNVHRAAYLFGPHAEAVDSLDRIAPDRHIDAIVNLAGEPLIGGLWTAGRKRRLLESRLEVTRQVVRLIERLAVRPEVLVSGSAIGYYGVTGDEALTESAPPQPIFMSRLCQEWEAAARGAEMLGVRVCRLRIGLVLGADGGAFPQLALPVRLGLGAVLGTGRQWMSWIHKRDLVRLILFALDRPEAAGAINATAPGAVTNAQFTRALGRRLRRPVLLKIPAFLPKAALGELADLFVAGQRVVPDRALSLGFRFDLPTLDRALDGLVSSAERRPVRPETWSIYYNDACPVCRAEIGHYRKEANEGALPLTFHRLSLEGATLGSFGLGPEEAKRRLYVMNSRGELCGGADAFATIWDALPRYRWAARLIRLPLLHGLAGLFYDGVLAPALVAWNRRRDRHHPRRAAHG